MSDMSMIYDVCRVFVDMTVYVAVSNHFELMCFTAVPLRVVSAEEREYLRSLGVIPPKPIRRRGEPPVICLPSLRVGGITFFLVSWMSDDDY